MALLALCCVRQSVQLTSSEPTQAFDPVDGVASAADNVELVRFGTTARYREYSQVRFGDLGAGSGVFVAS
jgi:hypothetical protein